MGTDTSMQNSLASTQLFRMLGVSGDDLGEAIILSKTSILMCTIAAMLVLRWIFRTTSLIITRGTGLSREGIVWES